MGFKNNPSMVSSVITGLVNVFSTVVSDVLVDKVGRKPLLLQACVQMLISQGTIGRILGFKLHDNTYALEVEMEKTYLLRIVNAALNDDIFFAIAGHNMIVTLSCPVSLHTPQFPANEPLTVHRRFFYT
ncbi:hypothetical protein J5N97_017169 [Dioscorea zingiberensis]|uniref:Plastocyanin-like domain-containing protein n=1 Tax=Dioscorea zingiberensis TaxID=325984 RepID=A0A9D5CLV1_9LILI|nr:hypothetical protein J5N97_017169 [Dioscorea zingiberensis]